jgi:hypothetical protein
MDPAAQNKANLAHEGLAVEYKANFPGRQADAARGETAADPVPVGT